MIYRKLASNLGLRKDPIGRELFAEQTQKYTTCAPTKIEKPFGIWSQMNSSKFVLLKRSD
jgi:hypothetical protein